MASKRSKILAVSIGGVVCLFGSFLVIPFAMFGMLLFGSGCHPVSTVAAEISIGGGQNADAYFAQFAIADRSNRMHNAQTIISVGRSRKLSDRDIAIAVATAIQENNLKNDPGGDLDSLGLFQQRPTQGWGTPEQIMDPIYATNKFFDALEKIPNRDAKSLIEAAMAVQHPNPAAYRSRWAWDAVATEIVAGSSGSINAAPSPSNLPLALAAAGPTASPSPSATVDLASVNCNGPGTPDRAVQVHGAITGDDYPYKFSPTWDIVGVDKAASPLGYLNRECVDFVAWRLNQQLGITSPPFQFGGMGNAKDWKAGLMARGFVANSVPTVGAVVWWSAGAGDSSFYAGGNGHVAMVSKVNANGSIEIEQYNIASAKFPEGDHQYHMTTLQPEYFVHVLFLAKAKSVTA